MILDKEQDTAARCIENHSIIIAGAGCGKTTTLLKKIDYLISQNVSEKDILVVSFTNETVNNFKNKCKYDINICTFHKLALLYQNSTDIDIVFENLLDETIKKVLKQIDIKLKKIVYKIYRQNIKPFSINRYNQIINSDKSDSVKNQLKSLINIINAENIDISKIKVDNFSKRELILFYIVNSIYILYSREKKENHMIDFDDMIKNATKNINNKICKCSFKYILVDEYQDISMIRLEFLKSLIKSSNAILTVVGDDFQSIYGFSGSNINLFYEFSKHFKNSKQFYITKTYRCPQNIISIAGNFIMKNNLQIKKSLISNTKNSASIKKVYYTNKEKSFKKIIDNIKDINKSVLILSRNNYDIKGYLGNSFSIKNSYLYINAKKYSNIRFLSIHKSKGLEADIVIILNLSRDINGFPSLKNNDLINKIKPCFEKIKYPEERRLFYVAMTRCKESLYLLIDLNKPSSFIKEV